MINFTTKKNDTENLDVRDTEEHDDQQRNTKNIHKCVENSF